MVNSSTQSMGAHETQARVLAYVRVLRQLAERPGMIGGIAPRALVELARERLSGSVGLASLFRAHGRARPDRIAFEFEGETTSYAEADRQIDRLVTALASAGVGPKQRVVVALGNRPLYLQAQAALVRMRASPVALSPRATASEVAHVLTHARPRAVIAEGDALVHALAHRATTSIGAWLAPAELARAHGVDDVDRVLRTGPVAPPPARRSSDPTERGSLVVYTSGTTGKPKGAVRSLETDSPLPYLQLLAELPLAHDERHLVLCPLYHSTAFAFAALTFVLGGTVVIEPRFDARRALDVLSRSAITSTAVVPTMLRRMLVEEGATTHGFPSLRAIVCGGAPLYAEVAREAIEHFGPRIYNFYGATETGINTVATPDELLSAPGTIGHAMGGSSIRILDERLRDCGVGEVGRLFVKNELLTSYLDDDAATRASMHEGHFTVGDLAHRDARGLFHIDGRAKDMLISGGVNVYPAEVEAALRLHPGVRDAAIVGEKDLDLGERVVAFYVADGPIEDATLRAFMKERVSGAKVPKRFVRIDELPMNATGKIDKNALRVRLAAT